MLFKNPRFTTKPRSILVYRTARLGDFIVAIPAIVTLRRHFPRARIILLTTISTKRDMQIITQTYTNAKNSLPWLSLVIPDVVDEAIVFSLEDWKSGIEKVRRCVHDLEPEATFILPFSGEGLTSRAKKLLFLWLAGVRSPVYGRRVRSTLGFMRGVQYQVGMFEHQVWAPLHAVMECPLIPIIEEKDVMFSLTIDSNSEAWAQDLWSRQKLNAEKVVAIFPGGSFPHKRWPLDKFIQLCHKLYLQTKVAFVVVGASSDQAICNQLYQALSPESCLNLVGKTTVNQLAAVLKRCALFVGNDSGPAHLASAVGCPCVTLTSSIEYPWWEPWNSRKSTIRHSVPCEYCFSYTHCPINTSECVTGISIEKVFDICEQILKRTF